MSLVYGTAVAQSNQAAINAAPALRAPYNPIALPPAIVPSNPEVIWEIVESSQVQCVLGSTWTFVVSPTDAPLFNELYLEITLPTATVGNYRARVGAYIVKNLRIINSSSGDEFYNGTLQDAVENSFNRYPEQIEMSSWLEHFGVEAETATSRTLRIPIYTPWSQVYKGNDRLGGVPFGAMNHDLNFTCTMASVDDLIAGPAGTGTLAADFTNVKTSLQIGRMNSVGTETAAESIYPASFDLPVTDYLNRNATSITTSSNVYDLKGITGLFKAFSIRLISATDFNEGNRFKAASYIEPPGAYNLYDAGRPILEHVGSTDATGFNLLRKQQRFRRQLPKQSTVFFNVPFPDLLMFGERFGSDSTVPDGVLSSTYAPSLYIKQTGTIPAGTQIKVAVLREAVVRARDGQMSYVTYDPR